MAKITTTNQKKNTMMPGIAYPATVLALATTASYPQPCDLFESSPCDRGTSTATGVTVTTLSTASVRPLRARADRALAKWASL
jgi:hypothetical protein